MIDDAETFFLYKRPDGSCFIPHYMAETAALQGVFIKASFMRKYLSSLLIALIAGCATLPSDAPLYSREPAPPEDKAILYIYRLGAYPSKKAPRVFVDDKLIMRPPERAYTWIYLPAGQYKVKLDWAWGAPDRDLVIRLDEGRSYYLKITGSYESIDGESDFSSALIQLRQIDAEVELKKHCRYIKLRN